MPLVICCDLDLPDGSGMDFLDEVRVADKELPFILASCHDKEDYKQEAKQRGATLCMDKMKGMLLQDMLVEYAYRQLSGGVCSLWNDVSLHNQTAAFTAGKGGALWEEWLARLGRWNNKKKR